MEALSSHDSITTAEVKETSSDGITFSLTLTLFVTVISSEQVTHIFKLFQHL